MRISRLNIILGRGNSSRGATGEEKRVQLLSSVFPFNVSCPDGLLYRPIEPFNCSIGLGPIGGDFAVANAMRREEAFDVARYQIRTIIGNDPLRETMGGKQTFADDG